MKILLAVDGSSFSDAAVRAVATHVQPATVEVLILQVVDTREVHTPGSWREPSAPFTAAKESVARAAEVLRAAGFSVTTKVAEGEVRSAILDAAAEYGAEMIVLGSHGRTGLRRFALGSVAESVSRHAPCSVTIVRMPPASA